MACFYLRYCVVQRLHQVFTPRHRPKRMRTLRARIMSAIKSLPQRASESDEGIGASIRFVIFAIGLSIAMVCELYNLA